MSKRSPSAKQLIGQLRELIVSTPPDEDAINLACRVLLDQHGYTQQAIADAIGMHRQRLSRILATRKKELARYRAMCGGLSVVMEVLITMPVTQREQLRCRFEATGRPYSQAALRRFKQGAVEGNTPAVPVSRLKRPPKPATQGADSAHGNTPSFNEERFLQELATVVAHAQCKLIAQLRALPQLRDMPVASGKPARRRKRSS